MNPPSSLPGAVVVDANIPIAIASNEVGSDNATIAINHYLAQRYEFYAPGAILAETLYVLCGKLQDGTFTAAEHAQAIQDFDLFMSMILPPPQGEGTLVLRAETFRGTYTCRRSADGIYIALAEELAASRPTVLLTFDADMSRQAARFAPGVTVHLLSP
jgi:predicted nucleic acid-binding protein